MVARVLHGLIILAFWFVSLNAPLGEIERLSFFSESYAQGPAGLPAISENHENFLNEMGGGSDEANLISNVFGEITYEKVETFTATFISGLIMMGISLMAMLMIENYNHLSPDSYIFIISAVMYLVSELINIGTTIAAQGINFDPKEEEIKDFQLEALIKQKESLQIIFGASAAKLGFQGAAAAGFATATGLALSQYMDLKKTCGKSVASLPIAMKDVTPERCALWAQKNFPEQKVQAAMTAECTAKAARVAAHLGKDAKVAIETCMDEDRVPGQSSVEEGIRFRRIHNDAMSDQCMISEWCPDLLPGPDSQGVVYNFSDPEVQYYVKKAGDPIEGLVDFFMSRAEATMPAECRQYFAGQAIESTGKEAAVLVAGKALEKSQEAVGVGEEGRDVTGGVLAITGAGITAGQDRSASKKMAEALEDPKVKACALQAARDSKFIRNQVANKAQAQMKSKLGGELKKKLVKLVAKAAAKVALGSLGGPVGLAIGGVSLYFTMRDIYAILKIAVHTEWYQAALEEEGDNNIKKIHELKPYLDDVFGHIFVPGAPCLYSRLNFWDEGYYVTRFNQFTVVQEEYHRRRFQKHIQAANLEELVSMIEFEDARVERRHGIYDLFMSDAVAQSNSAGAAIGVAAAGIIKSFTSTFAREVDKWLFKPLGRAIAYGAIGTLTAVSMALTASFMSRTLKAIGKLDEIMKTHEDNAGDQRQNTFDLEEPQSGIHNLIPDESRHIIARFLDIFFVPAMGQGNPSNHVMTLNHPLPCLLKKSDGCHGVRDTLMQIIPARHMDATIRQNVNIIGQIGDSLSRKKSVDDRTMGMISKLGKERKSILSHQKNLEEQAVAVRNAFPKTIGNGFSFIALKEKFLKSLKDGAERVLKKFNVTPEEVYKAKKGQKMNQLKDLSTRTKNVKTTSADEMPAVAPGTGFANEVDSGEEVVAIGSEKYADYEKKKLLESMGDMDSGADDVVKNKDISIWRILSNRYFSKKNLFEEGSKK